MDTPVQLEVKTRVFSRHKPLTLDIPDSIRESRNYIFRSTEQRECRAKVSVTETDGEFSIVYTFKKSIV